MDLLLFATAIVLLAIWWMQSQQNQSNETIQTISKIVLNLKKRPSKKARKELIQIVDNETATPGEKALAESLLHMRHRVEGVDAAKLIELRNDLNAPDEEREAADIVLSISKRPSDEAQQRLERIVQT